MARSDDGAASKLLGLTLSDGWKVTEKLPIKVGATGGHFSQSYVVKRDGEIGFLKAMDLSEALVADDTADWIRVITTAYQHERELVLHCNSRRMSRVVSAITHGTTQVPGMEGINGRVFYLVFEMADGDVRSQVDETKKFDSLWSMRALRDVCLGLWQVHNALIAHQDIKPSNVLLYPKDGFKIADFGRASLQGRPIDHDAKRVAGDATYSPPELLYGVTHPEFAVRRFGCDMYMLGNLAAFLFSGVNVTAVVMGQLDEEFRQGTWQGTYAHALPYIQEAFTRVLADLAETVDPDIRDDIVPVIRQLCEPDPARRGHPRAIGRHDQYSLQRHLSHFNLILTKLEIKRRVKKFAK